MKFALPFFLFLSTLFGLLSCAPVTLMNGGGDAVVIFGATPVLVALDPNYFQSLRAAIYKGKASKEFPGGYALREFETDGKIKETRGLDASDLISVKFFEVTVTMVRGSTLPFQDRNPVVQNGGYVTHFCYGSPAVPPATGRVSVVLYHAPDLRMGINLAYPNGDVHVLNEVVHLTQLGGTRYDWNTFSMYVGDHGVPNGLAPDACRYAGVLTSPNFEPPLVPLIDFTAAPQSGVLRRYNP